MRTQNESTLPIPSLEPFFPLHPQNHLTFPAPDHHGQSVFNPPPCGANQVTTPLKRVWESLAHHGERRRQLYYQWGKAKRVPTPRHNRSNQDVIREPVIPAVTSLRLANNSAPLSYTTGTSSFISMKLIVFRTWNFWPFASFDENVFPASTANAKRFCFIYRKKAINIKKDKTVPMESRNTKTSD